MDRGADVHLSAALGTGAAVDLEDAPQEFRAAVVFDLLFVDGFRVEALTGLRTRHNQIAPLAVRRDDAGVERLVRAGRRHHRTEFLTELHGRQQDCPCTIREDALHGVNKVTVVVDAEPVGGEG